MILNGAGIEKLPACPTINKFRLLVNILTAHVKNSDIRQLFDYVFTHPECLAVNTTDSK